MPPYVSWVKSGQYILMSCVGFPWLRSFNFTLPEQKKIWNESIKVNGERKYENKSKKVKSKKINSKIEIKNVKMKLKAYKTSRISKT